MAAFTENSTRITFRNRIENIRVYNGLYWEGGVARVPSIRLRENEPFEAALRRFKKSIEKEGVLSEVKKREHYEKPSVKKKKKALAARKKAAKTARMYRHN